MTAVTELSILVRFPPVICGWAFARPGRADGDNGRARAGLASARGNKEGLAGRLENGPQSFSLTTSNKSTLSHLFANAYYSLKFG